MIVTSTASQTTLAFCNFSSPLTNVTLLQASRTTLDVACTGNTSVTVSAFQFAGAVSNVGTLTASDTSANIAVDVAGGASFYGSFAFMAVVNSVNNISVFRPTMKAHSKSNGANSYLIFFSSLATVVSLEFSGAVFSLVSTSFGQANH